MVNHSFLKQAFLRDGLGRIWEGVKAGAASLPLAQQKRKHVIIMIHLFRKM
jgi:hypothetical protein